MNLTSNITFSEEKNELLKLTRNVSFEDALAAIASGAVLADLEHKKYKNQKIFVLTLHGYTYAVPYVINAKGEIFLKTIYPSRILHKKYHATI